MLARAQTSDETSTATPLDAPTATTTDTKIEPYYPTPEAKQYTESMKAAASAYVDCLKNEQDRVLTRSDFSNCDSARSDFAQYVPVEIKELALGCLEERAIGSAFDSTSGCTALARHFEWDGHSPRKPVAKEVAP